MAVEKVSGGTVKNTVGLADRVRNILQSVENLFNLAMVERVFEDASIPCSKLQSVCGQNGTYNEYIATLTQSGTNAPTAQILVNTFPETPSLGYSSGGVYGMTTVSSLFTSGKTVVMINRTSDNVLIDDIKAGWLSTNSISIFTLQSGAFANDILNGSQAIWIRVYE